MSDNPGQSALYVIGMNKLVIIGKMLDLAELNWLGDTLAMCHILGPIQYPTEYHQALSSGSIDAQSALVETAIAFRKAYEKVHNSC